MAGTRRSTYVVIALGALAFALIASLPAEAQTKPQPPANLHVVTGTPGALAVSAGGNQTANEGSSIAFAGTVSGGTAPYTYAWTFGDGGTATGSLSPAHAYKDNGSFTATLSVIDSKGLTGSGSLVATVKNVSPTVSLSGPTNGNVGTSLSFIATGSDPSSVDQTAGFTFKWNFGDGGTATGAAVSHTYSATGTYTVSVTATDKDGGVSTPATTSLTISPPSSLVVSAGSAFTINEGGAKTFAGTVTGGVPPYTYAWTFGDGGTSTASLTPAYTYKDNGTFTATLTVTDSKGSINSASVVATVNNVAPTGSLSGPTQGNTGEGSVSRQRQPTQVQRILRRALPLIGISAMAKLQLEQASLTATQPREVTRSH